MFIKKLPTCFELDRNNLQGVILFFFLVTNLHSHDDTRIYVDSFFLSAYKFSLFRFLLTRKDFLRGLGQVLGSIRRSFFAVLRFLTSILLFLIFPIGEKIVQADTANSVNRTMTNMLCGKSKIGSQWDSGTRRNMLAIF